MKKKIILSAFALMCAVFSYAQGSITSDDEPGNIDEDTTSVSSLDEIVKTQEMVYTKKFRDNVVKSVWKRKSSFSIAYTTTNLEGDLRMYNPKIDAYEPEPVNQKFKNDWGVTMKIATTVRFHKRPIADIVSFGLDYSLLDLSVNHYKELEGDKLYKSSETWTENINGKIRNPHYIPWGLQMYNFTYGMNLGPSIGIAPFARFKNPQLAHLRLHLYFNVGYRASLLLMKGNDDKDAAQPRDEKVKESSKLQWGHGFYTMFGLRMSWKGIGIGYELVNGSQNYKSVETEIYGSRTNKLKESSHRIVLSYIW